MCRKKDPIISTFARVIQKHFSPCKIILFGSRATGKAKKGSDYDFIIVSQKFRKIDWEERSAKAYRLKRNIPVAMDIICYTPQEFEKKKRQIGIVQQALKEGIDIKG